MNKTEQTTRFLRNHGIPYYISTVFYEEKVIAVDRSVIDGLVNWKAVDVTDYTLSELRDWLGY